jgi:hypothetical protein
VRAAVPAQCTLRSDADALALAVHAALEVDGAPPSCARLCRSRRPAVRWCPQIVWGHPRPGNPGFLCAMSAFLMCVRAYGQGCGASPAARKQPRQAAASRRRALCLRTGTTAGTCTASTTSTPRARERCSL